MVNYQKNIRDLREDRDLKQSDVAKILNTTQSTYSKYEKGLRQLSIEQLAVLCKYYNVSADYFLGFTKKQKPLPNE